ncbi:hypothetical protein AD951_02650 [Acetobacter malorum]|uniref:Uncharacterized protein n=1 Tax=Acetobacter malorum TaxID=178901 RepID=A0A149URK8_9PROT|nr:hypothetical protein [Acetobacter malorum]KXV70525.1 hypothetical protein AD951_02650 [Acetobacter malorum]
MTAAPHKASLTPVRHGGSVITPTAPETASLTTREIVLGILLILGVGALIAALVIAFFSAAFILGG